jgi:acetyl-CoA C-acetyltransferase
MSEVFIAGIGSTPVGEHWDQSLSNLAAKAMLAALRDSGEVKPQALYVGNLLASAASGQANLGTKLADNINLTGIETFTVEAGEASGAAALRMGYLAVKSGYVDSALVVGVEKYTDVVGPEIDSIIAQSADFDFESMQGITPIAQAALLMQRYLDQYQPPRGAFAVLPLLAHANAVHNPDAMYQKNWQPESKSTIPVQIAASNIVVDALALHDRPDPLAFNAAGASVKKALQNAGLGWEDMDLFELWDAASIYGVLTLEACGFAAHGEGWRWLGENDLSPRGKLPLLTMGGNKARGFPLGTAGLYQAVEAVRQLRGQAGENQVPGARTAILQALGGPAATAITHIFTTC